MSRTLRSDRRPDDIQVCDVPKKIGSHQGHAKTDTFRQPSHLHSGGNVPARSAVGSLGQRVFKQQEYTVETSDSQIPLDGRSFRETSTHDKS